MNKMLKDFVDKVEKGEYTKEDADKFKKEYPEYEFGEEITEED